MSLLRGGCVKDSCTPPTGSQATSLPIPYSHPRCGNAGRAQCRRAEGALLAWAAACLGREPSSGLASLPRKQSAHGYVLTPSLAVPTSSSPRAPLHAQTHCLSPCRPPASQNLEPDTLSHGEPKPLSFLLGNTVCTAPP